MKTMLAFIMLTATAQAQTEIMSPSLTGVGCECKANGKTWPCRKVKGDPMYALQTVNRCFGGGLQLVCPEDKDAICQYQLLPPICSDPPLSDVCYAGDEPK